MLREEKARKERKRWIISKAREHPVYYQIYVSLEDISPKIWRRLLVLPSTSLKTLSKIIQIAMGWSNYHLHQFIYEDERYGIPWEEDPDGTIDYKHLKLHDFLLYPRETMVYEYDFGDGWKHRIKLEDILINHDRLQSPLCVEGARHCPPEDCGGVTGYARLTKIVKNQSHKEGGDMQIMPLGDRVLVKPLDAEDKTKGGIILPDTAKEKPQEGKVVAVGKGKIADDGK